MKQLAIMLGDEPERAIELLEQRRMSILSAMRLEKTMNHWKQGNYMGRLAIIDELIRDIKIEYPSVRMSY